MPKNDKPKITAGGGGAEKSPPVRVVITDPSAVARSFWANALSPSSDVHLLPSVSSVVELLKVLMQQDSAKMPEVVLLHVSDASDEAFTSISRLMAIQPKLKIIVTCAHTPAGAMLAVKALTVGAVDSIFRPASGIEGNVPPEQAAELLAKVLLYRSREKPVAQVDSAVKPLKKKAKGKFRGSLQDALVVGCSTGGPQALQQFLSLLPHPVPVPVLVVQHMPPRFTTHLAASLSESTGHICREAKDGERIEPGVVHLAPGGYHMEVRKDGKGPWISLNRNPPENWCRPAVDPMFRTAAAVFGKRILAVVMTGVGEDGRRGAEVISQAGGLVYVQDEASSVVWGMPGAIARAGIAKEVLPIPGLVARVTRWLDQVLS